jgi:starch-binding outer membrane protein, SusD/RagB family
MTAECQANLGHLPEAIDEMNLVRKRADVDMPLYNTAAMDTKYPVTNLAEFMVALEHERKVELCGEQVRFDDLVRWDRLNTFLTSAKLLNSIPKADKAALVFSYPKNMLWPIPQKEIDVNPKIDQSNQNPGF